MLGGFVWQRMQGQWVYAGISVIDIQHFFPHQTEPVVTDINELPNIPSSCIRQFKDLGLCS